MRPGSPGPRRRAGSRGRLRRQRRGSGWNGRRRCVLGARGGVVAPLFDQFERRNRDRRRGALRRHGGARRDARRGGGLIGRRTSSSPRAPGRSARSSAQGCSRRPPRRRSTASPALPRRGGPVGRDLRTHPGGRLQHGALSEGELPASVLELTEPAWKGRVELSPTNASFQAFVSAMRLYARRRADPRVARGHEANEAKTYEGNTAVVEAVAAGEIERRARQPLLPVAREGRAPGRHRREPLPRPAGTRGRS